MEVSTSLMTQFDVVASDGRASRAATNRWQHRCAGEQLGARPQVRSKCAGQVNRSTGSAVVTNLRLGHFDSLGHDRSLRGPRARQIITPARPDAVAPDNHLAGGGPDLYVYEIRLGTTHSGKRTRSRAWSRCDH